MASWPQRVPSVFLHGVIPAGNQRTDTTIVSHSSLRRSLYWHQERFLENKCVSAFTRKLISMPRNYFKHWVIPARNRRTDTTTYYHVSHFSLRRSLHWHQERFLENKYVSELAGKLISMPRYSFKHWVIPAWTQRTNTSTSESFQHKKELTLAPCTIVENYKCFWRAYAFSKILCYAWGHSSFGF
jgi:hypothetical protein